VTDREPAVEGARFGILGTLEVLVGGVPVEVGAMQQRRLLGRLLLSPGRQVSQSELFECMWPEADGDSRAAPADPVAALRVYVSRLRRLLPAGVGPLVDVRGYRLDVAADDVDAERFGRLVGDASRLSEDPAAAAATLRTALGLWRGPALAEVREERWAAGAAVRLEELRLVAVERLLTARLALGEHADLCAELESLVGEHPLREALWGQLVLALYRSGRQADALRAYQRLRETLAEELGIEPSRELVELENAVLRQDRSLDLGVVARGPGSPAGGAAERGEVSPASSPAPTLQPAMAPALPIPATSFVGREREKADIGALLADARLVTLVGSGGAGKTRLALELSLAAQAEGGGEVPTRFVELAALREPSEVATAVASALGLRARPDGEPLENLVAALRGERVRVLLDNCEHLLLSCAQLCESLLPACPGVRILATSRERLGVDGEAVYRVPSLGVPRADEEDADSIATQDSVKLFLARARTQQSSFELDESNAALVASTCRRLDGIPLAIELAAARLGALSLVQIHDRLDERFRLLVGGGRARLPRQQTLRALIDWSYDLLGEEDRWTLRHLSVFAGGFDLESAGTVLGSQGAELWDVIDGVTSLVDKSLVSADTSGEIARYRLPETIRQYAEARLAEEDGPEAVTALADAHAGTFLELAERAAPRLVTAEQFTWLDRLDLEFDNLRSALAHLLERQSPRVAAMRLVVALERFVDWRYHERALSAALDSLAETGELDRADALAARVTLIRAKRIGQFDPSTARSLLAHVPDLARELGEYGLLAETLNRLAWFAWSTGDYAESGRLHEEAVDAGRASGRYLSLALALSGGAAGREDRMEALELARRAGDSIGSYMVLCNLGAIALDEGDVGVARQYFEEALPIIEAARPGGVDPSLFVNLGNALVLDGERDGARPLYARALETARRHLDKRQAGYGLLGLALCAPRDEAHLAAVLHGAAERQFERAGFAPEEAERRLASEDQGRLRELMGEAAFEQARAEGAALEEGEAVDRALGRGSPPRV
jgi:predicted ATPase/DNA-binding SARP family transcriptional activator